MITIFNRKVLLLGAFLCASQAQAMENLQKKAPNNPNALITLSIRANFSNQNKQYISDAVTPGLTKAQFYISQNKPWYFTAQMEKPHAITGVMTLPEYHESLVLVEHSASTDANPKFVGAKHEQCLTQLWSKDIKDPIPYAGQFYAVHMYVHGYDGNQQEFHQHYSLPMTKMINLTDLKILEPQAMVNDLEKTFPNGISHLHYVLAYDPNTKMPGGQARPNIITNVNILMDDIKGKENDKQCPMKDYYDQKHNNFDAHVTVGVIKTVKGIVTEKSPRIQPNEYKDLVNVYQMIVQGSDLQKLSNISFDGFSINGMTANGKQKVVVQKLQ